MKQFKIIDVSISGGLIALFGIWMLVAQNGYFGDAFLMGLISIGAWQSISMLVHSFNDSYPRSNMRDVYHLVSFVALVTLPLGSYWLLIYAGPVMALFYTGLCYYELTVANRRPLSYIK